LGEVLEYGRRAPVRRSLVEDAVKPRPSLAEVLGRGALRRSEMGQGIVAQKEDRPPPPGVIDEVYRDKRAGQPVGSRRQEAVEGIVRILQEKAKSQPTVINVGGDGGKLKFPSAKDFPPSSSKPGYAASKGTQSGDAEKTLPDGDSIYLGRKITIPPEMSENDRREMAEDLKKNAEKDVLYYLKGFLRYLTGKANRASGNKQGKPRVISSLRG